ncbi:DUF4856 domain-containing protein [Mesohalobacter halotolerans]|uniref:DUF4856 domain-containing protein n=1 Tax=Mesohalobacter halotolerans TaxID=1883405 RepID=A0A4U5TVL1_9FLAO|nr:DUF4856 domain-containing protein [Mesohalobacter halotolerans]MBS3739224.1 DUF4856 domain-containing protein [Psychroflexus sp.]TKS57644.1 DUF4856 domain-containing protein [Mesohalobacter halotolerans]
MRRSILSLSILALIFTSCSDDDSVTTVSSDVEAPASYTFEREGQSTVSFSGQTTRILMGDELNTSLLDNTQTETELLSMFAHQQGDSDFLNNELNASDKNIRSKTAASRDFFFTNSTASNAIKTQFETWISEQVNEIFTAWDDTAAEGVAGQIQEAGGGSIRYVNAKGLEYNQAIIKGLIGALMTDQMLNNYLSPAVLDQADNIANNDNDITEEGKNYTTMEHKWDEAFGYLYGTDNPTNPQLNQDSFLNKYLSRVENDEDFAGIAQEIYDAFKLGRAAIVAKEYELRDQQAELIKEKVSEIIGIRSVYYLQQGKNFLANDKGAAFHDLSEGFGFIYSLKFTRQPNSDSPYFTANEVDTMLTSLLEGNGFWDVSEQTLDDFSDQIAARFNFTVEQAAD